MNEPYGDRQQEIVIIGQQMDNELITNALNQCLLSDDDMRKGLDAWRDIEDPFSEAWEDAINQALVHGNEGDHHTHDHEHGQTITIETMLSYAFKLIKLFRLVMYDYALINVYDIDKNSCNSSPPSTNYPSLQQIAALEPMFDCCTHHSHL